MISKLNRKKYNVTYADIYPGVKLRVKSQEWYDSNCDELGVIFCDDNPSSSFVRAMSGFCGREVTIKRIDGKDILIGGIEGMSGYIWNPEWFEFI